MRQQFLWVIAFVCHAACATPRPYVLANEAGVEPSPSALRRSYADLGWELTLPHGGWQSASALYQGVRGRRFRLQGTSSVAVFIGTAFKRPSEDVFDVILNWKMRFRGFRAWYVRDMRIDKEGCWAFHAVRPLNGITLISDVHGIPIPSHPRLYFIVAVTANEAEYGLCQPQIRILIRSLRALP